MIESKEQILLKQPYVSLVPLHIAHPRTFNNIKQRPSSSGHLHNVTFRSNANKYEKVSSRAKEYIRCELCLNIVSVWIQCQGYCNLKFCSPCSGIADIKRSSKVYRSIWRCKQCRTSKNTSLLSSRHLPRQSKDYANKLLNSIQSSQAADTRKNEDSSEASSDDSECSQINRKTQWVSRLSPSRVNGNWRKRKKRKLNEMKGFKQRKIHNHVSERKMKIRHSSRQHVSSENIRRSFSHNLRPVTKKVKRYYPSDDCCCSESSSSSSSSSLSSSSSSSSSSEEDDEKMSEEKGTTMARTSQNLQNQHSRSNSSGKFLRPKPTPTLHYKATVVLERLPIKQNRVTDKTSNSKANKAQKRYKATTRKNRSKGKFQEDSDYSDSDFYQYQANREILNVTVGDFVWAKLGSQRWWPALVIWGADCGQPQAKHNHTWVLWCGDHKISEVPKNKLLHFIPHFNRKFNGFAGYKFEKGVVEVLTELADRAKVQGITKERNSLLTWAKNGFPCPHKKSEPFAPDPEYPIPEVIRKRLNRIKAQYLKNMWSEKGVSLVPRFVRLDQLQDEESALKKVREGTLKIQEVCIACDTANVEIITQHPLIEGGLCSYCRDEIKETMFAYGDDGTNAYCVICGQAGELLICDSHDCNRCYCTGCIDVLVSPGAHIKVQEMTPWLCYLCHPYDPELNGLIQKKEDWQQNVMQFFNSNENIQFPPNMDDYKEKKPIRVLSLFDGIGTGRLVLEQLGIEVDVYYASEIDKDAINISLVQHKGNIIQLGDIENITDAEVSKLCPIDLVIGGSPCNDLALVNPKRKGLYDPTGTGKLFFDFFRVLRAVQMANKGRHVFWLYENVAGMPSQYKSTITRFLQCEPTLLDAKYFSAQRRPRFFWGNIPGMYTVQEYWSAEEMPSPNEQEEELYQPVTLNSVLTPYLNRKASLEKIGSVTTNYNSLRQGKRGAYPVTMNGEDDVLWITELEQVFGFPRHYTDIGNVHLSRRQQLLGKAWSVPVIRHLFTSLKNFFKTSPSLFLQKNGNKES